MTDLKHLAKVINEKTAGGTTCTIPLASASHEMSVVRTLYVTPKADGSVYLHIGERWPCGDGDFATSCAGEGSIPAGTDLGPLRVLLGGLS